MSTKFYYLNEIVNANISATSENAQFPISNLLDDRRSKVFRSTSNSDSLTFDFGYAARVDTVMIVDDPIGGNKLLTCRVYLDNDPAFGSAIYEDMTIDQKHGFAFANFDGNPLMRYMKIVMTSTAGYCEIAKLFAGAYVDSGEIEFSLPFSFSLVKNATVTKNRLGQKFIDEINSFVKIQGSLKTLTEDELDVFLDIIDYASDTKPLWLQFDAIVNNPNRLSGCYYLTSNEQQPVMDSSGYWSMPFNLEEAL